MEVTDWRAVSQSYIHDKIKSAIESQHIDTNFKPTIIVAACEDAIAPARIVRAELKARGTKLEILNSKLELYDEETNPFNVHYKPWTGSWSGARLLLVDKADNSRTSIAKFIEFLQSKFGEEKAGKADFVEAQIGVFVLHNKLRPKAADLPEEVLNGRYFVGENCENVQIAYPFNLDNTPMTQPVAHGEHASGAAPPPRKSLDHLARTRSPPPVLTNGATSIRAMSSHYVETIIERAVEEQGLVAKLDPQVLVAATDSALPVARALRQYLRYKAGIAAAGGAPLHDYVILNAQLEVYDEDANPYLAHLHGTSPGGAASLAGKRVLVVDKADATRVSLAKFIASLKEQVAAAHASAGAGGAGAGAWGGDPVLGVFVLHNKQVTKAADLPADITDAGRYFYGEAMQGDVQIAYPFNT